MVKALKEERYTTYSSAMSILALESYSTRWRRNPPMRMPWASCR